MIANDRPYSGRGPRPELIAAFMKAIFKASANGHSAGPIVRFRSVARDIAAERPVRRVALREGDELTEMQDDFNSMLDTLSQNGGVQLVNAEEDAGEDADDGTAEMTIISCDTSTDEEQTNAAV